MYSCLDAGDYAQAARVGDGLHPEAHLPALGQADCWVTHGRALARVRGRRDDAVAALRRAEQISSYRLCRDPFATGVIAELVARAREESADQQLQEMAHRAGLIG
jgi:hypothetical protein